MARLARVVIPGVAHHVTQRGNRDPLTDVAALGAHVANWRAPPRHGLPAGDADEESVALAEAIEARLRAGRPLGDATWIARAEAPLARPLTPAKRAPKAKGGES